MKRKLSDDELPKKFNNAAPEARVHREAQRVAASGCEKVELQNSGHHPKKACQGRAYGASTTVRFTFLVLSATAARSGSCHRWCF